MSNDHPQYISHFPQDGSGAISAKELLGVMRAMGQNPTEDEVLNLMLEADLDGNGTIEFPEFLELMQGRYGTDDQESDLRLNPQLVCSFLNGIFPGRHLRFLTGTKMDMWTWPSSKRCRLCLFRTNPDCHVQVTLMLGNIMTHEEVEELMAEADVVIKLVLGKMNSIEVDFFRMETGSWIIKSL